MCVLFMATNLAYFSSSAILYFQMLASLPRSDLEAKRASSLEVNTLGILQTLEVSKRTNKKSKKETGGF